MNPDVGDRLINVTMLTAYVTVPHEMLVDSGGHVCGPECPQEPPMPPLPSVHVRLRRRAWCAVKRAPGLRLAHKDRIYQGRGY